VARLFPIRRNIAHGSRSFSRDPPGERELVLCRPRSPGGSRL